MGDVVGVYISSDILCAKFLKWYCLVRCKYEIQVFPFDNFQWNKHCSLQIITLDLQIRQLSNKKIFREFLKISQSNGQVWAHQRKGYRWTVFKSGLHDKRVQPFHACCKMAKHTLKILPMFSHFITL